MTMVYEELLSSNLSSVCNDATLVLRQMDILRVKVWPKSAATTIEAAINTRRIMKKILTVVSHGNGTQLAKIIQQGADSILRCVVSRNDELVLQRASSAFLALATDIETLLWDLLLAKEKVNGISEQEEVLSSLMGNMTLAPHL